MKQIDGTWFPVKSFVITLRGHEYSERVAARCIKTARDVGGIEVEIPDIIRSL